MVPQKLRTMILTQLAQAPQSGYGITKSIHEATGWKPSYGSMYPQLEQLKEEGLVSMKEEGRKKIYSLTKEGKETIKALAKDNSELITRMRANMNTMIHMMGADTKAHEEMMELFFSALEKGENPYGDSEKATVRMKMAFLKLYKEGKLKKNKKKINIIMEEAAKKLEQL